MIHRAAPLLATLLLWAPTTAWSQDLAELEKTLQGLAKSSIPKTVLIKAVVDADRAGAGSGAIVSADGYILTCSHVVEISDTLEIYTSDGTKYVGKLLGRNKAQDYALVKIEAEGLSAFTIGDSDTVKPGDWVVALGHPGGPYGDLKPAFAAGKVLDLDRKLPVGMMSKYYNHAIMTDVPIFAGDSGGPLINTKGELVGINGAIVMINELAFAVPTNQIMAEYERLKQGEVIEGEKAGPEAFAEMQKLISPEDYAKMQKRMFKNFGKLFGDDSPLSKLFGDDSPLSKLFGGEDGGMPDLGELFGGEGGEMPNLGELFGGEMDLSKLFGPDSPFSKLFGGENGGGMPDLGELFGGENGEMPDFSKLFGPDGPFGKMFGGGENGGGMPDLGELFGGKNNPFGGGPAPAPEATGGRPFLGIRIAPAPSGLKGILVEDTVPNGPAAKAGLRKGDVVIAIAGAKTHDMAALRAALANKKPGDAIAVTVRRGVLLDTVFVEEELNLNVTLGSR